ncbi:T3SS effector HopA1 family protein [Undibacterium sp. TC4M20W]|uniref:T3SS effector HopA1 family protein n=1 Tax=unclassified Undibacterium TaxID=2630295 RepID=UPI003BEFFF6F
MSDASTNNASMREELNGIYAALQIHNQQSYALGSNTPIPVTSTGAQTSPAQALITAINNSLYGMYYVRDAAGEAALPSQNLVANLSQANQTSDRWDPGWKIYQQSPDGRVMIQKGERSRTAMAGEYAANKWPGMPAQAGELVNLRVYPGTADMQQGFYYAFGSNLSDQFDDYELIRFYFNVPAHAAAELLYGLTAQLNRYALPFRYKTLVDASAYRRADAAVLYIAKRHYAMVAALMQDLHASLGSKLRVATPMFCKTLMSGIGVAEEPGTGESFGMHRCRLVAEGMVDAWLAGSQSVNARADAVQKRFAASGIDMRTPYLNRNSVNLFETPVFNGGLLL